MIAASRLYVKTQIKKCNGDYVEIRDPFGSDDLPLSQIKNHYKLVFSPLISELDGNYHTDLVDCSLELYKKAGYDELTEFDDLYDLAINIKNTLLDPIFVKNSENFSDIVFQGISPEALPTNDKVFKILLTFQIRKDYDYQGV